MPYNGDFYPAGFDTVVVYLPFLVRLKISGGNIDGRTLRPIVNTCRNFQRFHFNLVDGCSQDMLELFIKCPATLKTCCGFQHTVLAEELVKSTEWPCVRLKKLHVLVIGVPRLIEKQECLLDNLSRAHPALVASMSNEVGTADQAQLEEEKGIEHIRQRWRQQGPNLTTEQAEALEVQVPSRSIQRNVYRRFGQPTQLQELKFGSGDHYSCDTYDRTDTLEFNLESGLAELTPLEQLKTTCLCQDNY
ncbi:hypothetical protein BGW39_001315 [Mortierella sp. 14UC]|nr:hypothetical protein BGW39_001315 [Mortierella sp. 14UC]